MHVSFKVTRANSFCKQLHTAMQGYSTVCSFGSVLLATAPYRIENACTSDYIAFCQKDDTVKRKDLFLLPPCSSPQPFAWDEVINTRHRLAVYIMSYGVISLQLLHSHDAVCCVVGWTLLTNRINPTQMTCDQSFVKIIFTALLLADDVQQAMTRAASDITRSLMKDHVQHEFNLDVPLDTQVAVKKASIKDTLARRMRGGVHAVRNIAENTPGLSLDHHGALLLQKVHCLPCP